MPSPERAPNDAGFTLAEVLAGIFVVALMVSGFAELTRRVAHTAGGVHGAVETARTLRLAQSAFSTLERADPNAIAVAPDAVIGRAGETHIAFHLSGDRDARVLEWTVAEGETLLTWRRVRIPADRFVLGADGVLRLVDDAAAPLLVAYPRRLAAGCQFDAVLRACR